MREGEEVFAARIRTITRSESFRRAQEAQKAGKFADEIAPVEIAGRKGDVVDVDTDEGPAKVQFDKIPSLKPVFDKAGTVTAANASTINDGAAALVLMSADKAKELGLKPLARIVSYGAQRAGAGVVHDRSGRSDAPCDEEGGLGSARTSISSK